jgi:hypothetical protein
MKTNKLAATVEALTRADPGARSRANDLCSLARCGVRFRGEPLSDRPSSFVAERAVRYLHDIDKPASSVRLARELLSLTVADERDAKRVLDAAFAGDPRLVYCDGAWRQAATAPKRDGGAPAVPQPDIAFVLVLGARPAPRAPFALSGVAASRRRGETIVAACGGLLSAPANSVELRLQTLPLLAGARVVLLAPPGGLGALENWLEEPLVDPLPLPLLARRRLKKPSIHSLEDIAAALALAVVIDDDPMRGIEWLPACFDALRAPGESWEETAAACHAEGAGVPWSRYAFSREDLRALPPTPGTYRFYDLDSKLLYVGKSNNLRRRLASWFIAPTKHGVRGQAIVDAVHRFEIRPSGSDLEALLREATQIRRDDPERNVQRAVHARKERADRLRSILILEPAEPPWALRAWLIRDGRLLDTVPLGPRGGGLRRIQRVLDMEFFDPREGPRSVRATPIDVELVARWLTEHRDKAVAFDPTTLKTAEEVVERLRLFLQPGALNDPQGSPILPR